MFKLLKKMAIKNDSLVYWYRCFKARKNGFYYIKLQSPEEESEFFRLQSTGDKHKDKVIYHIKISGYGIGFFAIYRYIIAALYVCYRTGFEPYIQTYDTNYDISNGDNMFDYFFEQPTRITKKELDNCFNIVHFNESHLKLLEGHNGLGNLKVGYYEDDSYIKVAAELCNKYIHLKKNIKEQLNKDINKIIGNKKTVGIHYRGNGFRIGVQWHPTILSIEDYYDYIEYCLNNGYEQIFVATDEKQTLDLLQNRYGDKVICYEDCFRSSNGMDIQTQIVERVNNEFLIGYEVLRDMLTLSACDGLICGNSHVTISARIHKVAAGSQYEFIRIIDKGLNSVANKRAIKDYKKRCTKHI